MRSLTRIKVSDLLLNVGQVDDVIIDHLHLPVIVWLDDRGIDWKLHLQSIDNSTIIATLQDLRCSINDISDVSSESYIRSVVVPFFLAYFIVASDDKPYNDTDDAPIFFIDEKNDTIDTSDMIYQAIGLQEPFVKRTSEEEQQYQDAQPEDFDLLDDAPIGWQVVFRKVGKSKKQ